MSTAHHNAQTSVYVKNALVGATFGLALEKAKVYLPDIIINQMLMRKFTMSQMFLSATASGMLIVAILDTAGIKKRACKPPVSLGINALGDYGANIVGGLSLGIGMTLSGACPGTVLVQLGAGLPSAWYVLSGAMATSLIFGYGARIMQKWAPSFGRKSKITTVDSALAKHPLLVATVGATALSVAIYALTNLTSWSTEVLSAYKGSLPASALAASKANLINAVAWSPVMGGALVGFLQLPSMLLCGHPLGASGSYMELSSRIVSMFDRKWRDNAPMLADFRASASGMSFATGVVIGAFVSSYLGGTFAINRTLGVDSALNSIIGGALLLLGARLAGGCTSGHGISGMAQLSVASIITVAAMFAGGIASAFLLY